jgi:hypothetical protein
MFISEYGGEFLFLPGVLFSISTFVFSIAHLDKYREKTIAIIALFISSILLVRLL